jgi:death-on-curing protein
MMHKQLVEQTGGSDKVLDYGLLDSALETPFQTFDGKEPSPCFKTSPYPTLQENQ